MKWSKEQENQLRELAFAEKSNKEIAVIMGITLTQVHEGRSRFGITIAKVAAAKANTPIKRTKEVIQEEISKVEKAKEEAYKKIGRCNDRLYELKDELTEAIFKESLVEIARS